MPGCQGEVFVRQGAGLRTISRMNVRKILLCSPVLANLAKTVVSWKFISDSPLLYRWILSKCSAFESRSQQLLPEVYIETTLNCNARCIMCRHGYDKMTGEMDMTLYRRLIDECHGWGMKAVSLSVYGEPMADRYFFERVEYLRSKGMEYSFFSNGSLLTAERSRRLLELGGLSRLNFSVNAFSSQVYHQVTGMDCRQRTYDNILEFLRQKQECDFSGIDVGVSLVRIDANRNEVRDFISYWKKQSGISSITISDLWNRVAGGDAASLGEPGRLHRSGRRQMPCMQLWKYLVVYCDGKVAPCCDNADRREFSIGDTNCQSLRDIWNGRELAALRKMHLEGDRRRHKVCGKCTHNYYV